MIGATSGVNSIYTASQLQSINSLGSSSASSSAAGAGQTGQSSANISPLAQLLSDLQQLQAKSPDQFKQVVTQIASQLQAAAQQQGQTSQGQFLTDLAGKFQNVASTGDLSQLQPHHHHHGHHAHGAYNQSGQPVSSTTSNTSSQTGSSTDLQQLFTSLISEVKQALGT